MAQNVKDTWFRFFSLYSNVPSIATGWYTNLVETGTPNTGNSTVDQSILSAWAEYKKD